MCGKRKDYIEKDERVSDQKMTSCLDAVDHSYNGKNQSWPATGAQAEGNKSQHQPVWWLLVVGSVFCACRSGL